MGEVEIILVDNKSEDKTVPIARPYFDKLITIDEFKPGAALNLGVREASFEQVVLISGHCRPTNSSWLTELSKDFQDNEDLAGVYGRQIPTTESTPIDSRDLWTVFGLEDKLQSIDPFFHNANSLIRKSVWNQFKFNEDATNVEDRIWAKLVLGQGFKLKYSSRAVVEHWHGINHNGNTTRAENVVRVLNEHRIYKAIEND